MGLIIIAGVIIFAVGLLSAVRPGTVWTMQYSWKFKDNPEPSDMYLFGVRALGVVMCVVGAGLVIYAIVQGRADAQSAAEVERFLEQTESEFSAMMGSEAGFG